jgi:uncharacterized cupin superfamily protein
MQWLPHSNTKMIYESEKGESFAGPLINCSAGDTLYVEVSSDAGKDGYRYISQFFYSRPKDKPRS